MVAKHANEVLSKTSRSVRILNSIMMMRFDAVLSALSHGHLRVQCSTLKEVSTTAVQTWLRTTITSSHGTE